MVLAMAPADAQILYMGFSIGNRDKALEKHPGFYRSQDSGQTWQKVAGTPFEDNMVSRIAVSASDSRAVLVGSAKGLYATDDGGNSWRHVDALDAAAGQIFNPDPAPTGLTGAFVNDVVIDPFDAQVLYVATARKGVFRSRDAGATWAQVAVGMGATEDVSDLEADPNRRGVIYASGFAVYATTDGADTWRELGKGLRFSPGPLALNGDGTLLYLGVGGNGVYYLKK